MDDEVIRQATHAQAKRAAATRPDRGDTRRFAGAKGVVEVLIDAGKVNTRDGWRDVKVGLLCEREAGAPAMPEEWDTRTLPGPTVRTVRAAIEGCDAFGTRLREESDRLGVTTGKDVTVLATGPSGSGTWRRITGPKRPAFRTCITPWSRSATR